MKKLLILACLAALVFTMVAVTGCGDGGGDEASDAQAAVEAFFNGMANNDAETTYNLLPEKSRSAGSMEEWGEYLNELEDVTFEVAEVKVDGDTATVEVGATSGGQTETETVPLVKEDGEWKVDMANIQTD